MNFFSVVFSSATFGLLVGILGWSLSIILYKPIFDILGLHFFPFLYWAIFNKGGVPVDALKINSISLTLVSLALLLMCGFRYYKFDDFSPVSEE